MPHPQGLQTLWRLRQKVWVVEQPSGKHRGVVLIGCCNCHGMDGFFLVDKCNTAKNPFFPMIDHTLVQDMVVKAFVDTTMGGFLPDKTFDILRKAGLQLWA